MTWESNIIASSGHKESIIAKSTQFDKFYKDVLSELLFSAEILIILVLSCEYCSSFCVLFLLK